MLADTIALQDTESESYERHELRPINLTESPEFTNNTMRSGRLHQGNGNGEEDPLVSSPDDVSETIVKGTYTYVLCVLYIVNTLLTHD
jgi:hypothetical protein